MAKLVSTAAPTPASNVAYVSRILLLSRLIITGPTGGGTTTKTGNSGDTGTGSTTQGGNGTEIGNLFGNTGATTVRTPHSAQPTSGLNLLGQVESWGIKPATPVTNIALKIPKMTGAQLQQLLKHLPDGVTYGLDLEKENY